MDKATANKQWVDLSGDVSPGGAWYDTDTPCNDRCGACESEEFF